METNETETSKSGQGRNTMEVEVGHSAVGLTVCACTQVCVTEGTRDNKAETKQYVCTPTFVVLTLLPVLQLHPVRSGRTLHSSPSIHGCI